jgi:hypothetical protein
MFRPQKGNFPTELVKTMHLSEDRFCQIHKIFTGYHRISRSSGANGTGLARITSIVGLGE